MFGWLRRKKGGEIRMKTSETSAPRPGIEVAELSWENDKQDVLGIENATFPVNMRSDEGDLSRQAGKGFGLVVRREGTPVGYALAMALEQAPYKGCSEDAARGQGTTAYVESLAVRPGESPALLTRLTRSLLETLEQKSYQRATAHVETDSPLYKVIMGLGGKELGRFDNWQGWGKKFAYVEFPLR